MVRVKQSGIEDEAEKGKEIEKERDTKFPIPETINCKSEENKSGIWDREKEKKKEGRIEVKKIIKMYTVLTEAVEHGWLFMPHTRTEAELYACIGGEGYFSGPDNRIVTQVTSSAWWFPRVYSANLSDVPLENPRWRPFFKIASKIIFPSHVFQ